MGYRSEDGGDVGEDVDDGSEDADPGEPGDPALHPSDEPLGPRRCQEPCPVVLRTRDRLDGGHFRQRGDLAEHARYDDEKAPDDRTGPAIPEDQANVTVLS